jgi:hypothetical protein
VGGNRDRFRRARFRKCGITIRHSELPVVVPLARLMTA